MKAQRTPASVAMTTRFPVAMATSSLETARVPEQVTTDTAEGQHGAPRREVAAEVFTTRLLLSLDHFDTHDPYQPRE
jgi:hypothetical protein